MHLVDCTIGMQYTLRPLTFYSLTVTVGITSFNFPKFYILPAVCLYVVYVRTNSEFCPIQLSVNGVYISNWCLYKREGQCLLRGTNWIVNRTDYV